MLKYIFNILFYGLILVESISAQWCCLDTSLVIPDKTTQSLRIKISGALLDNLADPNQGVCGVRVKFKHKFIGDLTMDLISPSGQRVRLIGPIGASGNTNFSVWNVTFVPKSIKPVPDPGFKPKWDNIQPWGIFGQFYNGTYHPSEDSLESFNIGPVNGQWLLSITDNEDFYSGVIESFCLLFCEPAGINCSACSPNGGFFANTEFAFCEGVAALQLNDKPDFQGLAADSNLYDYRYLIIQNDRIHSLRRDLDLRNLPNGNYTLCGLSFLKPDSVKIPAIGEDAIKFKNNLIANTIDFCGEFSKNCIELNIYKVPQAVVVDTTLCKGEYIEIDNVIFDKEGSYPLVLKSVGGCDSLMTLNLSYEIIEIKLLNKDTITCAKAEGVIDISNSLVPMGSQISWSTTDGNIIDKTNPLRILVNKDGNYIVHISTGNCTDSIVFPVIKIGRVPELRVNEPVINCDSNTVTLIAGTSNANLTYKWSLNGNELGTGKSLQVDRDGRYLIVVTDNNGCTNAAFSNVTTDKEKPGLVLDAGTITCKINSASVIVQTTRSLREQQWTGPNGYNNDSFQITVNQAGKYYIVATGDNGCQTTDSIEVTQKVTPPMVILRNDTIKCGRDSIPIFALSNAFLDTILFTGPGNFRSTDLNPFVKIPGTYFLRLVDTAGCSLDTSVIIGRDTTRPNFKLLGNDIDCINDSVQLQILHNGPATGFIFRWTGPPGFTSKEENPFVKEKGTYIVQVTSPNGCTMRDSIQIDQDSQKPEIDIVYNDIDCLNSIANVKATSINAIKFEWTGPALFTAGTDTFSTTRDGIYKVIVTSSNGCTSEKSIVLETNQRFPIQSISSDTINCIRDSANIKINSSTTINSVAWRGPNGFASNNVDLRVALPGWYVASAKGKNGCENIDSVLIVIDTIRPAYQLFYDTITCLQDKAFVSLNLPNNNYTVVFTRPDSVKIRRTTFTTNVAGEYYVEILAPNGCSSFEKFQITDKSSPPVFALRKDTLTCTLPQFIMNTTYNGPGYKYTWSGPGFSIIRDAQINVSKGGKYTLKLQNEFGCEYADSVDIISLVKVPNITISDPTFNCETIKNPYLTATLHDSIQSLKWTFPDLVESSNNQILVNQAGIYYFEASDPDNCFFRDTLLVKFDTVVPKLLRLRVDSINCIRKEVTPIIQLSDSRAKITWIFPNGDSSNILLPTIKENGIYTAIFRSANECESRVQFPLIVDTIAPLVEAIGGELNCTNGRLRLQYNVDDINASIIWTDSAGNSVDGKNPSVDKRGIYTVLAIKPNGCSSKDTAAVTENKRPPRVQISKTSSLPCVGDSLQLSAIFLDSVISYQWKNNNWVSFEASPFVKDTGWYTITIIGVNNCATTDSLYVNANKIYPEVKISGSHLNCIKDSVILEGFTELGNKFYWTGPGINDSIQTIIKVGQPGKYQFKAINSQRCETDSVFIVLIDTTSPVVNIFNVDSLICERKNISIMALPQVPGAQYNYAWSSNELNIIKGQSDKQVYVDDSGKIALEIVDVGNGCKKIIDYDIRDYSYQLSGAVIKVIDPNCFASTNGSVELLNVANGKAPYSISLDGIDYKPELLFSNLLAGNYTLYIKDSNGCVTDTTFSIDKPGALTLNLGRDTTIRLGESFQITPVSNADTTQLNFLQWLPETYLDCISCFSPTANPLKTTRYKLRIVDQYGCPAEDDILIKVNTKLQLYIPTVFSPNGDQINDHVTITIGDDISKLLSFRIYDRWGTLVYEGKDIMPGQGILTWDGTLNGRLLNPAVFVYIIDVEQVNGLRQVVSGEITLLK